MSTTLPKDNWRQLIQQMYDVFGPLVEPTPTTEHTKDAKAVFEAVLARLKSRTGLPVIKDDDLRLDRLLHWLRDSCEMACSPGPMKHINAHARKVREILHDELLPLIDELYRNESTAMQAAASSPVTVAANDSADTTEESENAILASADSDKRAVLESHLRLSRQQRARKLGEAHRQINSVRDNEKMSAIQQWTNSIVEVAEHTAHELIRACVELIEAPDDELIATFVAADYKRFIESSARSMAATHARGWRASEIRSQMARFVPLAIPRFGYAHALDIVRTTRFAFARKQEPAGSEVRKGNFHVPRSNRSNEVSIKIFISHSAKDEGLAAALVECLQNCLDMPGELIRCTSVRGYRLPPGSNASAVLRENLKQCLVVIGLLTEESLQSGYVIMELGAAWGLEKITCPVLTPSVDYDRVPGPLNEIHAIKTDSIPDIAQLIEVVAEKLGLHRRPSQRFTAALEKFVRIASAAV